MIIAYIKKKLSKIRKPNSTPQGSRKNKNQAPSKQK